MNVRHFWAKYEQSFGAWASIIGLPMASLAFLPLGTTIREIVFSTGFVLICVGGFICSGVYSYRLSRKSRYAEVMPKLKTALAGVISESLNPGHKVEEKKGHLAKVMDDISGVFSILTGSSCRACIKMVRGPSKKQSTVEAVTFCRSSDESAIGESHPVAHNTAFNSLFQDPAKLWFFGNDLPEMASQGAYTNTNKDWKKKYRSTIVWPIRKPSSNPQTEALLVGFLCVDSKKCKSFSEEFDYPIGAIIASALYPFIEKLSGASEVYGDGVYATRVAIDIKESADGSPVPQQGVANGS